MTKDRAILEVEPRSETGKGAARSLRREGYVPGVIYGYGEETRLCKVPTQNLEKLLTSVAWENTLIDLKLNSDKSIVLIREVQLHPFKPEVLHVDFLAVHKGEKLRLEVPIRLIGSSPGVKEGGIMEYARHEVEIRCEPDSIPEALELDISGMTIGDSLTVGDLQVPAGVELLEEERATICAVVPPTKIEEPVEPEVEELALLLEEEEEGEPELVGRGKPSEGEEEGEEEGDEEEPREEE